MTPDCAVFEVLEGFATDLLASASRCSRAALAFARLTSYCCFMLAHAISNQGIPSRNLQFSATVPGSKAPGEARQASQPPPAVSALQVDQSPL